ncbi:MAG: class I SAM-dependent methyltransferase [Polyangiaceae bacterium]
MTDRPRVAFDEEHAANYDKNFEKLAAFKDALHILTRAALSDLPDGARVLCVGAGTGAELLYLAEAFPSWTFTALDLAAPMLDVCRRRVEQAGIGERCTFHVGPIASLREPEPFDVATSFLVSQFVLDRGERAAFFKEIARRLRKGGRLVSADLVGKVDAAPSDLLDIWLRVMQYNGATPEKLEGLLEAFRTAVAIVPEANVMQLIEGAGFETPTRIFQVGMIHAWHTCLAR